MDINRGPLDASRLANQTRTRFNDTIQKMVQRRQEREAPPRQEPVKETFDFIPIREDPPEPIAFPEPIYSPEPIYEHSKEQFPIIEIIFLVVIGLLLYSVFVKTMKVQRQMVMMINGSRVP